ncbi:MAG: flagellar hook-basal body complex protein [Pseudomonadota bacterium]
MDNAGYTTLSRQSGLLKEVAAIAHNLANMSTTGFRREGLIFSEFIRDTGNGGPTLSMASGGVRATSYLQGGLNGTGRSLDIAIEGDGFFLIATPDGDALTRAGNFVLTEAGELTAPDGAPLLDLGGAPIVLAPNASAISIGADGTVTAEGLPVAQIGLWSPADPTSLSRADGVRFLVPDGAIPAEAPGRILQGFLEESNVDPVGEVTRMIEVQRAYELGQGLLDREDERIRNVVRTLGQ